MNLSIVENQILDKMDIIKQAGKREILISKDPRNNIKLDKVTK